VRERCTEPTTRTTMARSLLLSIGVLLAAMALARADPVTTTDPPRTVTDEDRSFWSFQPLQRPSIPTVANGFDVCSQIDAFIVARLAPHGLQLVSTAPRERLIRRATLTLIGLPPTPEEVADFVADTDPNAWAKVVERLLANPHYGEKWASHWLDVARFAESYGFEHDLDNDHAWHYRDFVIRALNDDLPFDRFVRWQLAGDELVPGDTQARIATGFLAAGVHNASFAKIRVEQERYDELDDLVSTVGSAFWVSRSVAPAATTIRTIRSRRRSTIGWLRNSNGRYAARYSCNSNRTPSRRRCSWRVKG